MRIVRSTYVYAGNNILRTRDHRKGGAFDIVRDSMVAGLYYKLS
jgi:hypothetical protein